MNSYITWLMPQREEQIAQCSGHMSSYHSVSILCADTYWQDGNAVHSVILASMMSCKTTPSHKHEFMSQGWWSQLSYILSSDNSSLDSSERAHNAGFLFFALRFTGFHRLHTSKNRQLTQTWRQAGNFGHGFWLKSTVFWVRGLFQRMVVKTTPMSKILPPAFKS